MGFQERICAPYLSKVYSAGQNGAHYAECWIREHGVEKCHLALDMKTSLESLDTIFLTDWLDPDPGTAPINSMMAELLARTPYSRERGFEAVRREEDWKRPKNAAKDWTSKVKFSEIKLWDPRYEASTVFKIPAAEVEVRGEVEREATIAKAQNKLDKATSGQYKDPLNP